MFRKKTLAPAALSDIGNFSPIAEKETMRAMPHQFLLLHRTWRSCLRLCVTAWIALAALSGQAWAEAAAEVDDLRVEREADGIYVSAQLRFDLPRLIEDALEKGIAIHFVAEAEVLRERWYWSDQVLASAQRYIRVSYQPLTRRWRVNTGAEPLTSTATGISLAQQFDTLDEALHAVRRISRWRVAGPLERDHEERGLLRFRFRLDSAQLPRTFLIGPGSRSSWDVALERKVPLMDQGAR